jgi:hypothetical protein
VGERKGEGNGRDELSNEDLSIGCGVYCAGLRGCSRQVVPATDTWVRPVVQSLVK